LVVIAIVISEKGGAERHERYEQDEVTIGRVKGNDVLLPKGNVSKRHARLICRDGRYIVTDLKSTNGTYVNHRRITHATLVREGDRIYIGDFVLRIEPDARPASEQPPLFEAPDSSTSNSGQHFRASSTGSIAVSGAADAARQEIVSHFPIEHDPDESSPSLDVPGPPRVPSGLRPASGSNPSVSSGDPSLLDPSLVDPSMGSSSSNSHSESGASPPLQSVPATSSEPHTPMPVRSSQPDLDDRLRADQHRAHELVVGAVEEQIGVAALAALEPDAAFVVKVEAALDQTLATLAESGSVPPHLDRAQLREAARRELLDVGALAPLLDDDNITQVQVMLRDVVVHRRGARQRGAGHGYATEAGIARALARLCARAGVAAQSGPYVEAKLGRGRELFAVRPAASPEGHMVMIRRSARANTSLDDLVRSGAISRGMATLLGFCVASRANIIVAGSPGAGAEELIDALVAAAPKSARVVLLGEHSDEVMPERVARILLPDKSGDRAGAIAAAARLAPDYLVAPPLLGEDLASLLDQVSRGLEGVVLAASAATLRQAMSRLGADLARTRTVIGTQVAHEWLGSAFDIALEVTRLRDGRLRVVRLAELRGAGGGSALRDIFTFAYHRTAAGGSVEGAFYASGTVPRMVEDLAARGMPLDTSIFRRQPNA
jgi:pilus assembly protein CpaF